MFFVHNRVSRSSATAAKIAELVPEARIAVAHGKMGEHQLEQVVDDFWERKFDVLVSTTIIETGLDISNANTIIIDQRRQVRPRPSCTSCAAASVAGASAPTRTSCTTRASRSPRRRPIASRRSRRTTTSASGMQVALKDLEMRGAGNLLGAEQAGHIAGVGFDLYLRMIGEAVSDVPGRDVERTGRAAPRAPRSTRRSPRITSTASDCGSRPIRSCRPRDGLRGPRRTNDRSRRRGAHRPVRRAACGGAASRWRFSAAPSRLAARFVEGRCARTDAADGARRAA